MACAVSTKAMLARAAQAQRLREIAAAWAAGCDGARSAVRTTDRDFRLVVSDTRLAAFFRTRIMGTIAALAMRRERVQRLLFRTVSQIGIQYRKSPLSQALAGLPEHAPQAGDRLPWLRLKFQAHGAVEDPFQKLDDTRFNLIVIGQEVPSRDALALGDLLRAHVIPTDPLNDSALARVGVSGLAFYLLRPDGHVGLAGTRLETTAVMRYLTERIGLDTGGKGEQSI
jgi:hypothetical protein